MTTTISGFEKAYSALKTFEKKSIQHQVTLLQFGVHGGTYSLDTSYKVTENCTIECSPCSHRISVRKRNFQETADKTFNWLLSECKLARADNHRLLFGLNDEGLLHCSKNFSTYLMVAKASSRGDQERAKITQNQATETDTLLVVAKIAHTEEGLEKLRVEGSNLHSLQCTGNVVELWDPESIGKHLDQGVLLTVYYPAPLEQDLNMWLRKVDIEMLAVELLYTLDSLHQQGWTWNGLRTGHFLYNVLRHDERDKPQRLKALGLEHAKYVGEKSFKSAPYNEVGQRATGCISEIGKHACCDGDMHSLGLLLLSLCSRNQNIPGVSYPNGLDQQEKDKIIAAHNKLVYDESNLLKNDDWIITLIDMLLKTEPLQRPSAAEALKYVKTQVHIKEEEELVLGEVTQKIIPGYLDGCTRRFIWPIMLHSQVVLDVRHLEKNPGHASPRLTKTVTLKTCFDMKAGAIAAKYGGRPIHKRFARWLQLLELHTHSISDGADGALDGRRQANGIFDSAYYISTRQVEHEIDQSQLAKCI